MQLRFLVIIFSVFIFFYHPLTTVILMICLLIFEFIDIIKNKEKSIKFNFNLILLSLFTFLFIIWQPYRFLIYQNIMVVYLFLVKGNLFNLQTTLAYAVKAKVIDIIFVSILTNGLDIIIVILVIGTLYQHSNNIKLEKMLKKF